jgi:hypothetical protein
MVQPATCPVLGEACIAFINSQQAAQFAADHYEVLKEALAAFGRDGSFHSLYTFSGWAIAFNCSQTATVADRRSDGCLTAGSGVWAV